MPKLDINKIKRKGTAIFKTKTEMLKYIKTLSFGKNEFLIISYYKRKWFVRWSEQIMKEIVIPYIICMFGTMFLMVIISMIIDIVVNKKDKSEIDE